MQMRATFHRQPVTSWFDCRMSGVESAFPLRPRRGCRFPHNLDGKPLPVVIKKVKGTLRKHRLNPGEPKPKQFLGEPPEHLSDGAREAWRYPIKCAPPGLLSTLDGSVLMILACAADLFNKAQAGLAKTGLLIKSPEGGFPMQSPYLAIANKQAQIMQKAATETGFTPASRSRVSITSEAADVLDPWDEIAG